MTSLHTLHDAGQSPWLDNLTREMVTGGGLGRLVDVGVRGVTSNPTIFARALEDGSAYAEQLTTLKDAPTEEAYWEVVLTDVAGACEALGALHADEGGVDGMVSVEVDPRLAHDTRATVESGLEIHRRVPAPNLLVKVPATDSGVAAVEELLAAGVSVNVTLIFSLSRYRDVLHAHQRGVRRHLEGGGDGRELHSVASFFVSRVDTSVDEQLEQVGTKGALALRGRAAVAQAKLAYQEFLSHTSSEGWQEVAGQGGLAQRPLWASTGVKNPEYPALKYVEELVGPHTVNTMPEGTLERFLQDGEVRATLEAGVEDAQDTVQRLEELGISLEEVAQRLEEAGERAFVESFEDALTTVARAQAGEA